MATVKIVFPHQLFEHNPLFAMEGSFCLVEEYLFFKQYNFHKRKIAFHRATMKCYEHYLVEKKYSVEYIESAEAISDIRLLIPHLHQKGTSTIAIIDPVDDWLLRRIKKACRQYNINLQVLDTPMFLNTPKDLEQYFSTGKKKFFQAEFYKQQRIKRKILVDDAGDPVGGQWSFDEDNRKKFPKGKTVIKASWPSSNKFIEEALAYTHKYFTNNIGSADATFHYAVDHKTTKEWLQQFLDYRMAEFGDYEDAIVHKETLLNHSLLTPMLNVGLITPKEIIDCTLQHCHANGVALNSTEGFIRQVIGWREFIRGVYVTKGREERIRHYWGFTRKIPKSFYEGTTGIPPVDITIKKILDTGYCHHIERLMVLGNFMLLCEFDPDEVYRWFMELFIDAYDWVMVPNVYGMSQFADGGMMSTKPYIAGSNYLMKMSDYPKGEWQEIWDALFWRFMDKQRDFFMRNPRMNMLVKTFDKWDEEKRKSIHSKAGNYLAGLV